MQILLPFVLWIGLNSMAVSLLKKEFGKTLPFTMMISVGIIYLSQMVLGTFRIGWYILLVLSCMGYILLVWKKNSILWKQFFTPGLLAFFVIYAVAIVLNYRRQFTDFDEFWHWGMMIKESIRLDKFYCVDASRMIIHKDYPPFLALLEWIWVRASLGRYSESLITTAVNVFEYILLVLPATEILFEKVSSGMNSGYRGETDGKQKTNNRYRLLLILVVALCLTVIVSIVFDVFDHGKTFQKILADAPLAALYGYGLFMILTGEAFQGWRGFLIFVSVGITLVLTKQAGIALMLVIWLGFLLIGLLEKKMQMKRLLIWGAMFLLIVGLVYISWSVYVGNIGINDIRAGANGGGQFDFSKIDLSTYILVAKKQLPGLQQDTFWHLWKALLTDNITNIRWFNVSYVFSFFGVLLFLIIIRLAFKRHFSTRKAIGTGITLTVGTAGYAFMLSVMFLFCFTADEMQELRGYARYVDVLVEGELIALILFTLSLLKDKLCSKGFLKAFGAIIICIAVDAFLVGRSKMFALIPCQMEKQPYQAYQVIGEELQRSTESNTALTLIYDTENGHYGRWYGSLQSIVYYFVNDRDILWGKDLFRADYNNEEERQQVLSQIQNSDFLTVVHTNEAVNEFFRAYNNGMDLEEMGLHPRVDPDLLYPADGNILLLI